MTTLNASNSSIGQTNSASHTGQPSGQSLKRQPGDDFSGARGRRRGEDRDHGHKRQRATSPSRERYDGPPRRRSPERSRKSGGHTESRERDRDKEREREEDKPVALHASLNWFISQLPERKAFDGERLHHLYHRHSAESTAGPVFRTDDLMSLMRNAVIPSNSNRPRSPPPPRGVSGGGGVYFLPASVIMANLLVF